MPLILDFASLGPNAALSNGNLTLTSSGALQTGAFTALPLKNIGVPFSYFEFIVGTATGASGCGFGLRSFGVWPPPSSLTIAANGSVTLLPAGTVTTGLGALTPGTVVRVAISYSISTPYNIWHGWIAVGAGNWNASPTANPETGVGSIDFSATTVFGSSIWEPFITLATTGDSITANFEASSFTYIVPIGFSAAASALPAHATYSAYSAPHWDAGAPAIPTSIDCQMTLPGVGTFTTTAGYFDPSSPCDSNGVPLYGAILQNQATVPIAQNPVWFHFFGLAKTSFHTNSPSVALIGSSRVYFNAQSLSSTSTIAALFSSSQSTANFTTKSNASIASFSIVGSSSFSTTLTASTHVLITASSVTSFIGSHTGTLNIGTGGTTGTTTLDPTMVFYFADIYIVPANIDSFTGVLVDEGHGVDPHGCLSQIETTNPDALGLALHASDVGYRTVSTDYCGVRSYPPTIAEAFAIDRAINLAPADSSIAAAWGTLNLINVDNIYDSYVNNYLNVGCDITISSSHKRYENFVGIRNGVPSRGLFIDPPFSPIPVFYGTQGPWTLSENTLSIPLRDQSYWLTTPYQKNLYLGTGGYNGSASLVGVPLPVARGGTAEFPIKNCTPQLIDPINLIYQYSDYSGTVVTVYEGAADVFTRGADTINLFDGVIPAAGTFRTDNSRSLFQLGSSPVATITCDVTGDFVGGTVISTLFSLVEYMFAYGDITLSSTGVDTTMLETLNSVYPYTAGIYIAPSDQASGMDAVDRLLSSIGAKLYPTRAGFLSVVVLRAPISNPFTYNDINAFNPDNAVSLTPLTLPAAIDPPPYRIRVGYDHNYTVQTSGYLGAATAAQQQFAAQSDQYSSIASTNVLINYRRPNDLAPLQTCLLGNAAVSTNGAANKPQADTVAAEMLNLWGQRRRLYTLTLPLALGLQHDLGDQVQLTWPMDNLHGGQPGIIVGEQFVSTDSTIAFTVLV